MNVFRGKNIKQSFYFLSICAFYAYADLQLRLHLVPLPTCSSWMNPIEQDFSRIQRDVLDNSNFSCPKEAMKERL
jgi:hypothetical protein